MDAILTVVSGGLAGAVATLITQRVSEPWRVWRLSKSIAARPKATPNACRVRVWNCGKRSIEQAVAYISLTFDKNLDLVDGESSAFIGVHERTELNEDRLCWSIAAPAPNPVNIDIYHGERQASSSEALQVFRQKVRAVGADFISPALQRGVGFAVVEWESRRDGVSWHTRTRAISFTASSAPRIVVP
jgi:hypothetical protein